jgi:hypothetical protein
MDQREKTPDRQKKKKNLAWVRGSLSFVNLCVVQVEVSATGRSLVQRSSTECGVCIIECEQAQQYPLHLQ